MIATITVRMDNAAFENDPTWELAFILKGLAERLQGASIDENFPLRDQNGNRVGELVITED